MGRAMPYLVDGNNVLGSWGGPVRGEDRRVEVVRRVVGFCRSRGASAVLVFDGAPIRHDRCGQELGPVSIRYPERGRDADSVIRALIDASPRRAEWIVVTSDKALYSYVRTRGALVLRAHEWNALERSPGTGRPAPRRSAQASAEKPDHERDVEGWLSLFEASKPKAD